MDLTVLAVFAVVYLGMILGRIPGLALDRTGVAILGAIALLALGRVDADSAWLSVDVPTLSLLLGLMVVSAQFRLSGFYSHLVRSLGDLPLSPSAFLAVVIAVVGLLSAVLANDIVCLAVAPVLIESCSRRSWNPVPFLLALACAANVGSAATLIGNPQNMLIGTVLRLSFRGYLAQAALPSALGLLVVWAVIALQYSRRWTLETGVGQVETRLLLRWQTAKGFLVLGALVLAFLVGKWPREILALGAAGVLLCSRSMRSREVLSLVDWQLLLLFFALFVVNHAMTTSGNFARLTVALTSEGVRLEHPVWLFSLSAVLSNLVSNVPATMLLLPHASHPLSGPILALSSTLAGNLLVVGSIANIIVIDQAARLGVRISWREHARTGIPVTLLTLALAAASLAFPFL
ncbi:MAG: SLC13 family permease [Planctomycetota bacterium]